MVEEQRADEGGKSGEPRTGDRRKADRRKADRRAPVPWWRQPLALVGYGVAATLLVLAFFTLITPSGNEPEATAVSEVPPADDLPPPTEPEDGNVAFTPADYDRLIADGDDARGRVIRVELFCDPMQMVSVRDLDDPDPRIHVVTDDAGRVPGAECRWGRRGEERREAFFLVVPPGAVDRFADAPSVEDGFVLRRHIVADVTWIGRSPDLALRTVGVLREPNS